MLTTKDIISLIFTFCLGTELGHGSMDQERDGLDPKSNAGSRGYFKYGPDAPQADSEKPHA